MRVSIFDVPSGTIIWSPGITISLLPNSNIDFDKYVTFGKERPALDYLYRMDVKKSYDKLLPSSFFE